MKRRIALKSFSAVAITGSLGLRDAFGQHPANQDHTAWVASVLKKIETIKTGMTRDDLLTVFTTEGGISTRLHRTFVSRDCPYFKVDVEFKEVGRPNRDAEGRETLIEDGRDVIVKLSRP